MTRALRPLIALTLLLSVTLPARAADTAIQPGASVTIGGNGCTMNFVFKGGGKTYIGTAGHCGNVNQRAAAGGSEFGTIRYSRNDDVMDFALIEVDAAKLSLVTNSVRGWGGPSGVTDDSETTAGDEVRVSGYGMVVGARSETRARQGVLVADTNTHFSIDMPAVNGDSGGPILHARTGKALGIVSVYGIRSVPPTTDYGPTVEHVLRTLQVAGFAVVLQNG